MPLSILFLVTIIAKNSKIPYVKKTFEARKPQFYRFRKKIAAIKLETQ
jgi:hypothetical protein